MQNKNKIDIYFAIGIIILCITPIIFQFNQEQKPIINNSSSYNVVSICYPYNQTTQIPETLKTLDSHVDTGMVYSLSSIMGNVTNDNNLSINAIFSNNFLVMLNESKFSSKSSNSSNWNDTWGVSLQAGRIPQNQSEIIIQYKWWQQLADEGILPANLSSILTQPGLWSLPINLVWNFANKSYSSVYKVVGVVKIHEYSTMSELLSYDVTRDYINDQGFVYGSNFHRDFDNYAWFIFGTAKLANEIDSAMFSGINVENYTYINQLASEPKIISFITYFPHPTSLSLKKYWNIYEKIHVLDLIKDRSAAFQFKGNNLYQFYLLESNQIQEFNNDWRTFDFISLLLLCVFPIIWAIIRWNQKGDTIISVLNLGEDPGKSFRKYSRKLIWSQLLPYGISLVLFWLILSFINILPILAKVTFNLYLTRIVFLTLFMVAAVISVGFKKYKKISIRQTENDISIKNLLMSHKMNFTRNYTKWEEMKKQQQENELSHMEKSIQNDININLRKRKNMRWSIFGFIFIIITFVVIIMTPTLLESINVGSSPISSFIYWVGIMEILLIPSFLIIAPILIIRKWGLKLIKGTLHFWDKRTRLNCSSKQLYKRIFSKTVISDRYLLILIAFGIIGMIFCSGWIYSLEWVHTYQNNATILRQDNSDVIARGSLIISENNSFNYINSMLQNNTSLKESQFLSFQQELWLFSSNINVNASYLDAGQYLSYIKNSNQDTNFIKSNLIQIWSGFINETNKDNKYCIISSSFAKQYDLRPGDSILINQNTYPITRINVTIYAILSNAPLLYLDDPVLGNIGIILPIQLLNIPSGYDFGLTATLALKFNNLNYSSNSFLTSEKSFIEKIKSFGFTDIYMKDKSEIFGINSEIHNITDLTNYNSASVVNFISKNHSYVLQNIIFSAIFVVVLFVTTHKYLLLKLESDKKKLIFLGETENSVKKSLGNYEAILFTAIIGLCGILSIITNYMLSQFFTLHITMQIQLSNHGGIIGLIQAGIINFYYQNFYSNIPFVQIGFIFSIFYLLILIGLVILLALGFGIKTQEKSIRKLNIKMVNQHESLN